MLRLLDESTDLMSHDHSSALKFSFKTSLDHHLLSAAHESIGIGAVLAVFKAMLKLSEAGMSALFKSPYIVLLLELSSRVTAISSNLAENCVCVLICSSMIFPQLLHVQVAKQFKIFPLYRSKSDEDTKARDDITATFVIKPKFGISFESTRVRFHTLYKANFATVKVLSSRNLLTIS